jgi:hypothetical protein
VGGPNSDTLVIYIVIPLRTAPLILIQRRHLMVIFTSFLCNYPCSERGESFSQLRRDSREASGGLQDFIPGSETNYATSSAYRASHATANNLVKLPLKTYK